MEPWNATGISVQTDYFQLAIIGTFKYANIQAHIILP